MAIGSARDRGTERSEQRCTAGELARRKATRHLRQQFTTRGERLKLEGVKVRYPPDFDTTPYRVLLGTN